MNSPAERPVSLRLDRRIVCRSLLLARAMIADVFNNECGLSVRPHSGLNCKNAPEKISNKRSDLIEMRFE